MKLNEVNIKNFRCFSDITLPLHPYLTVIVAENGGGKSTLLDAVKILLWGYVSGFDQATNGAADPGNSISVDDMRVVRGEESQIMVRQRLVELTATGELSPGTPLSWTRYRDNEKDNSKTKSGTGGKALKQSVERLLMALQEPDALFDLPLFGYFGTGRLHAQKRMTKAYRGQDDTLTTDFYTRSFAYRDCLNPDSSYKHFRLWFIWAYQSYWEERLKAEQGSPTIKAIVTPSPTRDAIIAAGIYRSYDFAWRRVKAVQIAVDNVLKSNTGWHTLEYSISHEKSLILHHDEQGIMKADQLSDGIRSVLAMVGDIAYRCVKLNPHLGADAPQKTHGVVMIDEIEMHLHPRWQQAILPQLRRAFPNIQFIVTTHSPQVVSSVAAESIYVLDNGKLYAAPDGTQGAEASRILKRVFGTNTRPPDDPITKDLNAYLDLVYQDQWDTPAALNLRKTLDEAFRGEEPDLTKADLYIENRRWELDIEKGE